MILSSQTRHKRILRQIITSTRILLISSFDLLIQRSNMLREQPCELERIPFFRRKGSSFVEVGRVQESRADQSTVLWATGAERESPELGILLIWFVLLVL
jgi:hypothetical protein